MNRRSGVATRFLLAIGILSVALRAEAARPWIDMGVKDDFAFDQPGISFELFENDGSGTSLGPDGGGFFGLTNRFLLDTGATGTVINAATLVAVGYDPALAPERIQVTTGSGVEFAPRLLLDKVVALGREHRDFPVLCHTLPPSAGVDGLLGLDAFRGESLTVDFRTGRLILA